MAMTDLNDLAARVEALTGPDREVDALICVAVNAGSLPGAQKEMSEDPTVYSLGYVRHRFEGRLSLRESRRYTASIDAAMTLVPEGYTFAVGAGDTVTEGPWAWCCEPDEFAVSVHSDEFCKAATPALALTAATLRARSQQGENGNG